MANFKTEHFCRRFGLQCKYNVKLDLYFVSLRWAKSNLAVHFGFFVLWHISRYGLLKEGGDGMPPQQQKVKNTWNQFLLNRRWVAEFLRWKYSFFFLNNLLQQSYTQTPLLCASLRLKMLQYLLSVPPLDKYGTRPFLRCLVSQGHSPHMSSIAKNTFGPVGIPFIRGASGARQ